MPTKSFGYYNEDEERVVVTLPARWEDCPTCDGSGKAIMRSLRGIAFSAEDYFEDPEFFEDMSRGEFTVSCDECNGSGAMKVYDLDAMDPDIRARVESHMESEFYYAWERRCDRAAQYETEYYGY